MNDEIFLNQPERVAFANGIVTDLKIRMDVGTDGKTLVIGLDQPYSRGRKILAATKEALGDALESDVMLLVQLRMDKEFLRTVVTKASQDELQPLLVRGVFSSTHVRLVTALVKQTVFDLVEEEYKTRGWPRGEV